MRSQPIRGSDLLAWRRARLAEGGRSVDLDWLLDLGGGLRWADLQKLQLDPEAAEVKLSCSLDDLDRWWRCHLVDHKPLQHLVGCCPWRDFELRVSPDVLIPRQDTEQLVDLAVQVAASLPPSPPQKPRWADLGTGSGAMAVALARLLQGWQGHAVDCSEKALALARCNLEQWASSATWCLHRGHWWQPLKAFWGELALVVSNPPYIPTEVVNHLDPVVRDHEPRLALDGGRDGLICCRDIIAGAPVALAPGGWLLLEHHHDQSAGVLALMAAAGLEEMQAVKDCQGIRRFAIARRAG